MDQVVEQVSFRELIGGLTLNQLYKLRTRVDVAIEDFLEDAKK